MPFHTFKKERKWLKMDGKDLLELFWQTFVSNLSEKRLMLEIDIEYKWAVDDQCLESWSFKVFALINILCVHQLEMLFKAAEVFISVLFISETETFLLEIWSKIRWVACDRGAGRLRSLRWGLGNPGMGIVRRRMKKTGMEVHEEDVFEIWMKIMGSWKWSLYEFQSRKRKTWQKDWFDKRGALKISYLFKYRVVFILLVPLKKCWRLQNP